MFKIVRCVGRSREVVDEFDTLSEAEDMREEYALSDPSAKYLLRYPPKSDQHRADDWHKLAARHDS